MCLNFVDCVLVGMSFEFGDRMSNRVLFVELVLFLMFGPFFPPCALPYQVNNSLINEQYLFTVITV